MSKQIGIAFSLAVIVTAVAATVHGERAGQKLLAPACERTCPDAIRFPLEAAACVKRVAECQTKVGLYETYMAQLNAGTTLKTLPAAYVQALQPYYSGVNLQAYLYGYSTRQPARATTDCNITYYTSQSFVDKVAAGTLTTEVDFKLLFHEIEHFRQCMAAGGRSQFARMWWDQIPLDLLLTLDMSTIHGAMPMEQQAFSKQDTVMTFVRNAHLDASGHLVPALKVTLRRGTETVGETLSLQSGVPLTVTADITGGSAPIKTLWQWRHSTGALVEIGTAGSRNLTHTPPLAGSGELLFHAFQEGTELRASKRVAVTIQAPRVAVLPAPTIADNVTLAQRTLRVSLRNMRGAALQGTVCVGSSADTNRLGQAATSAGTSSFQLAANVPVTVTATAPGYVGAQRTLTTPLTDSAITMTLAPGSGGPACR